ncbi:ABC transporter ATP-binding protein [Halopelagius longus]|uniref:ABC-type D-xylose/L-arabinose transporter n=1 Tax=Halopelagius longus TaxID=1236180 RepID=A0A1H1FEI0_9EURY|nr:sn-glycerol-3-phosphate ABC transporter ATP-binding protein UgpC [Halopelagius longus]RDI70145.1 sn-glycerol-3-phosphate ABC transporter ATP-binding protein UgpC [Halopelagius longus]SDQ99218.1 carbohydrate ABC transporter ATP-binding protein, CUT1 family [Halopelagius longus]
MASINIDDVTKRFGEGTNEVVAVDDISMEIRDGEFVVFVGPSGSGKSTLLRMVAGLERQSEGDIVIGDTIVNELGPRARDIAMVFQNYALYPNMTVRENMSFGLKMSTGLSEEEIAERVESTAEMMGIHSLLDNTPGEMSGGQQQRVALGRAIVRDPNVFLMDEPLSNLDAKLRAEMRTEINRLQNDLGVTTLYVTHDQTEAMTMGDRLVVLDHGELQQIGTPLECFYRPANRFVAGFIGEPSMNFFEGHTEGGTLRLDGFDYDLTERMQSSVEPSTDVALGVRPEDLSLNDQPAGGNEFEAVVDVVEPMGSVSYVYLRPENGAKTDEPFIVETDGQRPISEDERVYVEVPNRDVHLFDGDTGETVHQRRLDDRAQVALQEHVQAIRTQ